MGCPGSRHELTSGPPGREAGPSPPSPQSGAGFGMTFGEAWRLRDGVRLEIADGDGKESGFVAEAGG